MFIENLSIRNYRGVKRLDFTPPRSPVVLPPDHAKIILTAIGILTKNEALAGAESGFRLRKNTLLCADLRLADGRYTVSFRQDPETMRPLFRVTGPEGEAVDTLRFFYRIHISCAESEARVYDGKKSFQKLLSAYEDPDRFYPPGAFLQMTEGIGATRLFRAKLKAVKDQVASESRDDSGNYDLFLRVNAMWDEIEKIRDLHHERWPVFISSSGDMEEKVT